MARQGKIFLISTVVIVAVGMFAWWQFGIARKTVNADLFGIAIKGYDPVAYFTEQRAIIGSDELEHEWQGARWRFANAKHKEMFAATPERYAPQYGGF